jgi:hypothetical protein
MLGCIVGSFVLNDVMVGVVGYSLWMHHSLEKSETPLALSRIYTIEFDISYAGWIQAFQMKQFEKIESQKRHSVVRPVRLRTSPVSVCGHSARRKSETVDLIPISTEKKWHSY